jgi:hypothetical protein
MSFSMSTQVTYTSAVINVLFYAPLYSKSYRANLNTRNIFAKIKHDTAWYDITTSSTTVIVKYILIKSFIKNDLLDQSYRVNILSVQLRRYSANLRSLWHWIMVRPCSMYNSSFSVRLSTSHIEIQLQLSNPVA